MSTSAKLSPLTNPPSFRRRTAWPLSDRAKRGSLQWSVGRPCLGAASETDLLVSEMPATRGCAPRRAHRRRRGGHADRPPDPPRQPAGRSRPAPYLPELRGAGRRLSGANRATASQRLANLRCVTFGAATVRTSSSPCRSSPTPSNSRSPLPRSVGTTLISISSTRPAARYCCAALARFWTVDLGVA